MTRWGCVLGVAALLSACAHDAPRPAPPPRPRLPEVAHTHHVTVAPPGWYWEPVDANAPDDSKARVLDLPMSDDAIVRVEGAARVWDDLGDAGRERLRKDAIVVLPKETWQLGAFYTDLRERRVPYLLTVDALQMLAHRALVRAVGEIEDRELAPALDAVLAKLDARLAAESRGAPVELLGGYRIARRVIAVARTLGDRAYVPPADLAVWVRDERTKIEAHATWEKSPVLGVPIDYTRFVVPAASAHEGPARALGWLAAAPFCLVAKTEMRGAPLDVGAVRHHARAAMILARLAEQEVDPQIHGAVERIARLLAFVWGAPDDVGLLELGDLAAASGMDLAKADVIANIARVDMLRVRARAARTPRLWDGSGGVGPGGVSVRTFGAHAAVDSIALSSFALADAPHVLPTTLDLAAWLGAADARAVLRESGADRRSGYDETLAAIARTRPNAGAPQLHASLHASRIASLLAWASSKAPSRAADRAKLESVLAAWTLARRAGQAFAQPPPTPAAPAAVRELRVSGGPLVSFVEPEPEAIAAVVGMLRQASRGLSALGPLAKAGSARALLAEVEDIARIAMEIAAREARDEPLDADEANALAALPSRLAAIDAEDPVEPGPRAVVVHSDAALRQALVSATGAFEPAVVLMKEPGTGRVVLAVGAHLSHFEGIEPTDLPEGAAASFERKLKETRATRAPWTASFRVTR